MEKVMTIVSRRYSTGKDTEYTGTVEYLVTRVFGYTLECGKSWENEPGNRKINTHPKTHAALVTQLNNAARNSAANGSPSHSYRLKK